MKSIVVADIFAVLQLSDIGFINKLNLSKIERSGHIHSHYKQQRKTKEISFKTDGVFEMTGELYNANSNNVKIIKAVLCCGKSFSSNHSASHD
jgi:hypothetical protein